MKKVFFLVSFILVSGFSINHAYAADNYNSSKSNTSTSISVAKSDIEASIDTAKSDALEIVDQILSRMEKSKSRSSDTVKEV